MGWCWGPAHQVLLPHIIRIRIRTWNLRRGTALYRLSYADYLEVNFNYAPKGSGIAQILSMCGAEAGEPRPQV